MGIQPVILPVINLVILKVTDSHQLLSGTSPIPYNALTYTGQPLAFGGDTLTYTEPE